MIRCLIVIAALIWAVNADNGYNLWLSERIDELRSAFGNGGKYPFRILDQEDNSLLILKDFDWTVLPMQLYAEYLISLADLNAKFPFTTSSFKFLKAYDDTLRDFVFKRIGLSNAESYLKLFYEEYNKIIADQAIINGDSPQASVKEYLPNQKCIKGKPCLNFTCMAVLMISITHLIASLYCMLCILSSNARIGFSITDFVCHQLYRQSSNLCVSLS